MSDLNSVNDETLVAFLDGELSDEQTTHIERLLESDGTLGNRLETLKATWNLLGELPEEAPNPQLAQSTMEMVALSEVNRPVGWLPWLQRHRWLIGGCLCFAALLIGAGVGRTATALFTGQLLSDLPTIAEYRSLQHIDSIEWLEKLATLEDLPAAVGDSVPKVIGDGVIPEDFRDRRKWVRELQEIDKGRLDNNREQFGRDANKERLREISVAIQSAADGTELLATARAYSALLDAVGSRESQRIQSESDLQLRFATVEQRVVRMLTARYASEMTPADKAAMLEWLDWLQWDGENFDVFQSSNDPDQLVFQELLYRDADESLITNVHTDELIRNDERLSTRARRLLSTIDDQQQLRAAIGFWVFSVISPQSDALEPVSFERLRAQFDKLRQEDRDLLELMPEDKARRELTRQLGVAEPMLNNTP